MYWHIFVTLGASAVEEIRTLGLLLYRVYEADAITNYATTAARPGSGPIAKTRFFIYNSIYFLSVSIWFPLDYTEAL